MKRAAIYYLTLLIPTLAMVFTSCDKHRPERDSAISLQPAVKKSLGTKAHLYENIDSLEKFPADYSDGWAGYGGYFHTDVYRTSDAGGVLPYFSSDVSYISVIDSWGFISTDNEGKVAFVDYYWPQDGDDNLDFFAYAPRNPSFISVDKMYNPPQFTCTPPLNSNEQKDFVEFMIAYTPNQVKSGGAVELSFQHPMSSISFTLKQAHRNLVIKQVGFRKMYESGTYKYDKNSQKWTVEYGDTSSIMLDIDKKIPQDINFSGSIGGPYLVLPQGVEKGLQLFVSYEWDDDNNNTIDKDDEYYKVANLTSGWEQGMKYTYSLDLGNNQEEILFRVEVEPWDNLSNYTIPIE